MSQFLVVHILLQLEESNIWPSYLPDPEVCWTLRFVGPWGLSDPEACRTLRFVGPWCLSDPEVCRTLRFVGPWGLSDPEACRSGIEARDYAVSILPELRKRSTSLHYKQYLGVHGHNIGCFQMFPVNLQMLMMWLSLDCFAFMEATAALVIRNTPITFTYNMIVIPGSVGHNVVGETFG